MKKRPRLSPASGALSLFLAASFSPARAQTRLRLGAGLPVAVPAAPGLGAGVLAGVGRLPNPAATLLPACAAGPIPGAIEAPGERASAPASSDAAALPPRLSHADFVKLSEAHNEDLGRIYEIPGVKGVGVGADLETGTRSHWVVMLDGSRPTGEIRRAIAALHHGLPGEVRLEIRKQAVEEVPSGPAVGTEFLDAARGAGLARPLTGLDDPRLSNPEDLLAAGWRKTRDERQTDYLYYSGGRVVQAFVVGEGLTAVGTYRHGADETRAEVVLREKGRLARRYDDFTAEQMREIERRMLGASAP